MMIEKICDLNEKNPAAIVYLEPLCKVLIDYSKSPVETIYVVFNGTDTLKYFLYERNTLIKSFTQKITDFSNCLDSIFIEETHLPFFTVFAIKFIENNIPYFFFHFT